MFSSYISPNFQKESSFTSKLGGPEVSGNSDSSKSSTEINTAQYDMLLKKKIQEMQQQLNKTMQQTSAAMCMSSNADNQAANGPLTVPDPPEIIFEPSGNAPEIDLGAPDHDKSLAERRRQQFLTMQHSIKEKMELYTASTKGRLQEMRDILVASEEEPDKKLYSITEEISKSGYFWTVLHYASHYGHYDVLHFLIDFLEDHPEKFEIFNMQTFEGKTPLFCAILSGDISQKKKQRIIKLWFDTNCVDLRLRKQSGEDLLQLAKKNKLYDFIVEYCLRED